MGEFGTKRWQQLQKYAAKRVMNTKLWVEACNSLQHEKEQSRGGGKQPTLTLKRTVHYHKRIGKEWLN